MPGLENETFGDESFGDGTFGEKVGVGVSGKKMLGLCWANSFTKCL